MEEDGSYLSNAVTHIVSGAVLGLCVGVLQWWLLRKFFKAPFFWAVSLIIGFVLAESIAGVVLWKMEVYRGLINIMNTTNHLAESLIFSVAGLIAGLLQYMILRRHFRKGIYWILASTLGWGFLILSTYLGIWAFIIGAFIYGGITGPAMFYILQDARGDH
jgi:hypothetical protein